MESSWFLIKLLWIEDVSNTRMELFVHKHLFFLAQNTHTHADSPFSANLFMMRMSIEDANQQQQKRKKKHHQLIWHCPYFGANKYQYTISLANKYSLSPSFLHTYQLFWCQQFSLSLRLLCCTKQKKNKHKYLWQFIRCLAYIKVKCFPFSNYFFLFLSESYPVYGIYTSGIVFSISLLLIAWK